MQHITKPNSKAFCFLHATKLGGAKKTQLAVREEGTTWMEGHQGHLRQQ